MDRHERFMEGDILERVDRAGRAVGRYVVDQVGSCATEDCGPHVLLSAQGDAEHTIIRTPYELVAPRVVDEQELPRWRRVADNYDC